MNFDVTNMISAMLGDCDDSHLATQKVSWVLNKNNLHVVTTATFYC